jgi:hypothetical protein
MSGAYCKNLKEQNPERYANVGKLWKDEDVIELLSNVQKGLTHPQIAETHKRTAGSIISKLKEIAADYYFNDERPINEIKKYTGLSVEAISEAISKRQYEMDTKKTSKKSAPSASAHVDEPVQQKGVSKDDFYNTMVELLTVAKDIQRMMKDFHADNFVTK